jgi:L-ascorbate metabolism protein UlaG (beta-lactamase superfamily)
VGIFELCHWLTSKGVEKSSPMNKGGTQEVEGLKITMVHADHSCGIIDGDAIIYGGEAVGYVLELEDGYRIYHTGDTAVFGDMRIIAELYRPNLVMLPIGDHFTMSPREAAYACRLLTPEAVLPLHYGTFPLLTGTPEALERLLREQGGQTRIIHVRPGESVGRP